MIRMIKEEQVQLELLYTTIYTVCSYFLSFFRELQTPPSCRRYWWRQAFIAGCDAASKFLILELIGLHSDVEDADVTIGCDASGDA